MLKTVSKRNRNQCVRASMLRKSLIENKSNLRNKCMDVLYSASMRRIPVINLSAVLLGDRPHESVADDQREYRRPPYWSPDWATGDRQLFLHLANRHRLIDGCVVRTSNRSVTTIVIRKVQKQNKNRLNCIMSFGIHGDSTE